MHGRVCVPLRVVAQVALFSDTTLRAWPGQRFTLNTVVTVGGVPCSIVALLRAGEVPGAVLPSLAGLTPAGQALAQDVLVVTAPRFDQVWIECDGGVVWRVCGSWSVCVVCGVP